MASIIPGYEYDIFISYRQKDIQYDGWVTEFVHHVAFNLAEAYALLGDYEDSVKKLTWAADNGFPNYTYFRDDPYLMPLHQFAHYEELINKLKILNDKFRKIANE